MNSRLNYIGLKFNFMHDESKITVHPEFHDLHICSKLDMLSDWIADLTAMYEKVKEDDGYSKTQTGEKS
jgi:hypothetical protein